MSEKSVWAAARFMRKKGNVLHFWILEGLVKGRIQIEVDQDVSVFDDWPERSLVELRLEHADPHTFNLLEICQLSCTGSLTKHSLRSVVETAQMMFNVHVE